MCAVATMAEERISVRKPAVAERRTTVVPRTLAVTAAARSIPIARSLQQRLGNQGAQAFAAQVVARSSGPGDTATSGAATRQLTLSQPGDAQEREADSVADRVMRMREPTSPALSNPPSARGSTSILTMERVYTDCEAVVSTHERTDQLPFSDDTMHVHRSAGAYGSRQVSASVAASIHDMKGGGAPLPVATRAFFEPRFDADLSHVRVHTGTRAAQTATSISAKAFTVGSDIAFAAGEYAPASHEGQRLLAHELTHVLQQNGGQPQHAPVARELDQSLPSVGGIIDDHTTFGFLDEKELGRNLARCLPNASTLTAQVLKELSSSDRDDVSYEIVVALGGRLSTVDEGLRMTFVRELVGGIVTDDEEGAAANVWISFDTDLPKTAERNRELWRKSLWESDQLCAYIKPYTSAFGSDVIGVAKAYLEENRRVLGSEALRYGFDLDNNQIVEPTNPDYLNQIRELVPQVVTLQKQMDELRQLRVGYRTERVYASVMDEMGYEIELPMRFDPDRKPDRRPKETEQPPWPTWDETNLQYQRINAVISAFASEYPSVYILMQQGKLKALEQAEDASKARDVILGAMQKTQEKIDDSLQKINSGSISYYDLRLIQAQLFAGEVQAAYSIRYPWSEPFFQDIGNDDIKGHEAREFWVDLGISLIAAAALVAAPFTGGASAAFLVGFGIGIGAGQTGMSWDKYLKLSMLSDASVSEELVLVAKGEVSAALVEAIVNTVSVFLDAFGARGSMKGATLAVKQAEAHLAKTAAEETQKKALREAMKDSTMALGGSALAVGMHELGEDDTPVPELHGSASEWELQLGPDTPELDSEGDPNVNRLFIFRVPSSGGGATGAAGAATATPTMPPGILTGADFELHIEKALLQGKVGNLPQMSFILPGQYNPQGWGIDRIGIVFHEKSGRIQVFHLEMKWVSPGSSHIPKLGKPLVGTQTGTAWTQKAVDNFISSNHNVARQARARLKNYLKKIHPGKSIDNVFMKAFLQNKLVDAPVRVVVPHWADFSKLYRQIAALARLRRIRLTKVFK